MGSVLVFLSIVAFSIWGLTYGNYIVEARSLVPLVAATPEPTEEPQPTTNEVVQAAEIAPVLQVAPVTEPTDLRELSPKDEPTPVPTELPAPTVTPTPFPPTVEVLEETDDVVWFGGNATPNSTVTLLTNMWTVGVTVADETGRWQLAVVFPVATTYEIFVRQIDTMGMEVFKSDVITWEVEAEQEAAGLPENAVRAVSSSAERCEGEKQVGLLMPNNQYRIGVCQSLTDIGRHVGVYLNLILIANPQIENQSLVHPGQIINMP